MNASVSISKQTVLTDKEGHFLIVTGTVPFAGRREVEVERRIVEGHSRSFLSN